MAQSGKFHRGTWSRFLHYLYLLPLLLGYRPLLLRFDRVQFIIYSIGFIMMVVLVIYSNHIPYIIYDEDSLRILLEYREDREVHRFEELLGYYRISPTRVILYSMEFKPLKLRMGSSIMNQFLKLLQQRGIQAVEKDVVNGIA